MKNNKIDITPSTNIYKTFKNYNYKPWDALAELIDNSTQSFKKNIQIYEKNTNPIIFVFYFKDEYKLMVYDNCFGVDPDRLDRILKLNVPIQEKGSRNEFGMGLKTSAFWFGTELNIWSKFIKSNKCIYVSLDLEKLDNIKNNEVEYLTLEPEVFTESCSSFNENDLFSFGTIIEIKKIQQKITTVNLKKIAANFSSKYRNDISEDGLEIRLILIDNNKMFDVNTKGNESFMQIYSPWEANKLVFSPPKLIEKNEKEVKILINNDFTFDNKSYSVDGWIGVVEKGSRSWPGLTLFRNKRSIKGDTSENPYKPYKIFKDAGSFEYQRIIGHLNVDDFPVTQQKNDFLWDNGLEEAFIDFIYDKLMEENDFNIIEIAKTAKNKKSDLTRDKIMNQPFITELKNSIYEDKKFSEVEIEIDTSTKNEGLIHLKLTDNSFLESGSKIWNFYVDILDDYNADWFSIQPQIYSQKLSVENSYLLKLNLNLHFFSPYNNEIENVRDQIIKFAVYFAYSELLHSKSCKSSDDIRKKLNWCFKNQELLKTE